MNAVINGLSVIAFPVAAFSLVFLLALGVAARDTSDIPKSKSGVGTSVIMFAVVLVVSGLKLVDIRALNPLWLQFALLGGLPAVLGLGCFALVVRTRRPEQ